MAKNSGRGAHVAGGLEQAERICAERGLRFTALRRKLLGLILSSKGPAKAYDLLGRLEGAGASAKPPTVYRTLDFLLENGFVHKLHSQNAYVGCAHPRTSGECYFLICGKCGCTEEYCSAGVARALSSAANWRKFRPRRCTVEVEGDCRNCRADGA